MKKLSVSISRVTVLVAFATAALADLTIEQLVDQAQISESDVAVRDHPGWKGAHKILIQDIGVDIAGLTEEFPEVEIVPLSSVDSRQHAADADAIVGTCDTELIAAAPKLAWVQIYWAGAEGCLSNDRLGSGEVILSNMQKMSSPVIAEHAIAMILALARKLPQFAKVMPEGDWAAGRAATDGMTPIAGKRLLVVGLGGIGTEVARLGAALGMRVTGIRNSSRDGPDFVEFVGLSHELIDLAASADVVVNALPDTPATRNLFDAEFFAAAKTGTIFVNVGRGKTVDTDALIAALESGQVSGAGLDVTEPEPLPASHPLWQRDDVIITPHVSSRGGERERHLVLLHDNLRRYMSGDKLLNVVDPKKGY